MTHPAERETPAGEAVREAVAQVVWQATLPFQQELLACGGVTFMGLRNAVTEAVLAGPIASELARLTAERDAAREDHVRAEAHICALEVLAYIDPEHTWKDAAVKERVARIAAEAALTTLRAEHAAEVARKDAEIARLLIAFHDAIRRPLGVTPDSGAEFYDYRMADEAEARRAALAPKETTHA